MDIRREDGARGAVRRYVLAAGPQPALETALAHVSDDDAARRRVAFEVLGDVALNYPPGFDAMLQLAESGCSDADASVRETVALALGQKADERVQPWLLRLLRDPDLEVRVQATSSLPLALDEPSAAHPVVLTLLALLADPEPRIRDWAACGLGTQLEVDSPEIRAGLRSLLAEPDTEHACPAAEAAVGLARRGDPEVIAAIADRLATSGVGVGKLWLEAARELGDPRLLPLLLRLRETDDDPEDSWVQSLEQAIVRCSGG